MASGHRRTAPVGEKRWPGEPKWLLGLRHSGGDTFLPALFPFALEFDASTSSSQTELNIRIARGIQKSCCQDQIPKDFNLIGREWGPGLVGAASPQMILIVQPSRELLS